MEERDRACSRCSHPLVGRVIAVVLSLAASCCSATFAGNGPVDKPFTLTAGSGLNWVKAADTREGHAAACLRNGLDPTPSEIFLPHQVLPELHMIGLGEEPDGNVSTPLNPSTAAAAPPRLAQPLWSEALLTLVASGLGLELERPGGVAGCCVPGMWCGPRGCYTLALGSTFSNHGGYVGIPPDEYSIYTCKEPSVPIVSPVDSPTTAPAVNGSDASSPESDGNGGEAPLPTSRPTAPREPAAEVEEDDGSPTSRPTVVSVRPVVAKAGEALMVVGTGFGEVVADVRVMVGGRACRDPELCHLVCRPCGDEDRCEFDEMCMEDGQSKRKVCLPICDGTEGSCPCDHRCLPKRFELQGEPRSMVVNLCRPPDADPNFLCHGSVLRDQERIQCTVPALVWDQAETESSRGAGAGLGKAAVRRGQIGSQGSERITGKHIAVGEEEGEEAFGGEVLTASVSLTVGDLGAVWEGGVEYAPRECDSVKDCDDGDTCSFDACVEGSCVHTGVQAGYGCQAQPADVMWRGDAYRYFQIVDRANPVEQAEFLADVQAHNKLSSVTNADDYPVEFHNWVAFPVYGTKYEDIYISPNGALFVPPLQTVIPGGLSAVSPSTEAFFPVLKADWNPSDSSASSLVLVMIEEDQFSVLYEDVFLFKRSASATPSTFSTTVFPDGSLRYRYMRIGDNADWTVGVSGNTFVSPTIRNRHVRQSEFIHMDEDGLPSAAATSEALPRSSTPPPAAGTTSSASNASDELSDGSTIITSGDGDDDSDTLEKDVGTEVTLCRAPTLACLARACGKAGSEIPVLWEGFGCKAAASLGMTFTCRIGGVEVPAVNLQGVSSSSAEGGFDSREKNRKEAWGPDWVGDGGGEDGARRGLLCEVPRLEWVEAGQEQAVMVPVEVLWSSPEQASTSAQQQVRRGAADVAVRGLSVVGDAGVVNSHVLAFRYYRDDVEAPDCGCSPTPKQAELTCDSCLVCGGDGSTKDCGGFCHGEAFISPCGDCSGGMTGVASGLWCDESREYLDGPAEAALLSLSQSVMMLVALSIMTAFLTTCLFLARTLMLRGLLAVEMDRHGALPRRVFSRHRGLSPSELEWLETFEYSTAGGAVSEDIGGQDISHKHGGEDVGGGGVGSVIELTKGSHAMSGEARRRDGGGDGGRVKAGEDENGEALGAHIAQAAPSVDCSICLGEFEDGDVLRRLPCQHFFHQKCVDEWLNLSISCPLCKRDTREELRRHGRRRRRARAVPQGSHQGSADATVTAAPVITTATHVGGWFQGLPASFARVFARAGGDGGGGPGSRQWQQVGDGDGSDEERDEDQYNGDESALSGVDEEARRRVLNANVAAFFGTAEPSPHVSPTSLSGRGGSSGSGGAIVVTALQTFFGRRSDGGALRGAGGRGGDRAVAHAEYELAPLEPAGAGAGVTRSPDVV